MSSRAPTRLWRQQRTDFGFLPKAATYVRPTNCLSCETGESPPPFKLSHAPAPTSGLPLEGKGLVALAINPSIKVLSLLLLRGASSCMGVSSRTDVERVEKANVRPLGIVGSVGLSRARVRPLGSLPGFLGLAGRSSPVSCLPRGK